MIYKERRVVSFKEEVEGIQISVARAVGKAQKLGLGNLFPHRKIELISPNTVSPMEP